MPEAGLFDHLARGCQRLLGALSDAAYAWQRRRQQGLHSGIIYARRVKLTLGLGLGHPTLGAAGARTWLPGRRRDRWKGDSGRKLLPVLQKLGLRADMRCIDYGCGGLRVGRHLIEFLEPDSYIGLDVVDDFYRAGRQLLDPKLVAAKRPRFGLVDETDGDLTHDFLFANAVVQHVPPAELDAFFARLARLTTPGSRSCALFVVSPRIERFGMLSWSYPAGHLLEAARRADGGLGLSLVPINASGEDRRGRERMALVMTRPAISETACARSPG